MAWHEVFSRAFRHFGLRDGRVDVRDISYSILSFFFGWSVVLPIFAIRINEITQSAFLTGVVLSLWGLVCLIFDIPMGILSDRLNKKRMMQVSLLAYVLIGFLYTVVNSVPALIVLRLVHSFAGCVFWIASWAIIRQYSTKSHREAELGVYTTLRSFVEILGPFVGAALISVLSWIVPFYVLSISCFITFLLVSALDIKSHEIEKGGRLMDELKDFFSSGRKIWGVLFGMVVLFSIATGFGSFLPIVMDNLGFSYTQIGIVMAIGMTLPWTILAIPVGIYADRHGRVRTALWGFIITAVGFALFHFSFDFLSVLLSTLILNIGFTLGTLTLNTLVTDVTVKGEYGGFTGLSEVPKNLAGVIGPIVVGFYLPAISMNSIVLTFAVVSLVSLPILYKLMK